MTYNPFDPALIADPYPAYAELLEGPRAAPGMLPSSWVVSRWSDVKAVLSNRGFSVDRSKATLFRSSVPTITDPDLADKLTLFDRILLTLDPPDHTRIRRLVGHAFTPRRVEELAGRIEAIAKELIDELAAGGEEADLIAGFAYPLPVTAIAELLGLPPADRELLKKWSDDVALLLDPFPSEEDLARFGRSIEEFRRYLDEQFDGRRRRPTDDLITALVAARDGDDALTDDELFALVVLLVAAGHETTTNLIGNSVIALTRHPDQRARLTEDPSVDPVDELARFDSPVQRTSRVATEPVDIGEVRIETGDLVILVLGAANHDPEVFPHPEQLDLGRPNASSHLSFGHGIHHCLGAPLARLEGRIALRILYEKFPRLEADLTRLVWKPSVVLRGVERLPVSLGQAGR